MKKTLLSSLAIIGLVASTQAQQVFYDEDFEGASGGALPTNMTSIDSDGDTYDWYTVSGSATQGTYATSASWVSGTILYPDNWMFSPAIDLTGASGTIVLEWMAYGQDQSYADEHYTAYVTTGTQISDTTTTSFSETLGATNSQWVSRYIDISAYAGQTIHIAFRHHDVYDMFRLNIDDIKVRSLPDYEVSMEEVSIPSRSLAGNVDIMGTIANGGANTITNVDLTWTDGTNTYTDNLTGLSIAPFSTYDFTHSTQFPVVGDAAETITVSVDLANDNDNTNNSLDQSVIGLTFQTDNSVVIEEGTGTWCGWCPRGAVAMEYMYDTYGTQGFVGIAVHNSDPMEVTEYDDGAGFTAFPGMNVDRSYLGVSVNQSYMETYYNALIGRLELAEVDVPEIDFDATTGDMTVTVEATFAHSLSGDYRFAVVLTEDGVTGTASGYDQVNYYSGGGNGSMGGYEALANPVPAADMVYDHVGFALVGGYDGEAGSLPTTIPADNSFSYDFDYTLSSSVDYEKVHVVGLLLDASTGVIINSKQVTLTSGGTGGSGGGGTGINDMNNINSVKMYPNPASDQVNIALDMENQAEVTVRIYNTLGEVVYNNVTAATGNTVETINTNEYTSGVYFVEISTGDQTVTQKLVIK